MTDFYNNLINDDIINQPINITEKALDQDLTIDLNKQYNDPDLNLDLNIDVVGFNDEELGIIKNTKIDLVEIFSKKSIGKKNKNISKYTKAFLKNKNACLILAYIKSNKKDKNIPDNNIEKYILFDKFEAPEELPVERISKGPIYEFPGGIKTVQNMGDFVSTIKWKGTLRGSEAQLRFNTLRELFRNKNNVTLIYKSNPNLKSVTKDTDQEPKSYNFIIEEHQCKIVSLKLTHKHQNNIDYEIALEPCEDLSEVKIGRSPRFEDISTLVESLKDDSEEIKKAQEQETKFLQHSHLIDKKLIEELLQKSYLFKEEELKKKGIAIIEKSGIGGHRYCKIVSKEDYDQIKLKESQEESGISTESSESEELKGGISYVPAFFRGRLSAYGVTTTKEKGTNVQISPRTAGLPEDITFYVVLKSKYSPGIGIKYYFPLTTILPEVEDKEFKNDNTIKEHFRKMVEKCQTFATNQNILPEGTTVKYFYFDIVVKNYTIQNLNFIKYSGVKDVKDIKIYAKDNPLVNLFFTDKWVEKSINERNKTNPYMVFDDYLIETASTDYMKFIGNNLFFKNETKDLYNKETDTNFTQFSEAVKANKLPYETFKKWVNAKLGVVPYYNKPADKSLTVDMDLEEIKNYYKNTNPYVTPIQLQGIKFKLPPRNKKLIKKVVIKNLPIDTTKKEERMRKNRAELIILSDF